MSGCMLCADSSGTSRLQGAPGSGICLSPRCQVFSSPGSPSRFTKTHEIPCGLRLLSTPESSGIKRAVRPLFPDGSGVRYSPDPVEGQPPPEGRDPHVTPPSAALHHGPSSHLGGLTAPEVRQQCGTRGQRGEGGVLRWNGSFSGSVDPHLSWDLRRSAGVQL
ncbi:hypothetical protein NHX12_009699 [Muraenolepis orangiensis]|uniref:Uncharacterized protein n=1 Tax=Muraenolepis orangiensis TaxID=630683 RepID=A0A9Q0DKT6_9TELE|nr:hypothetical protein NHX12_009699 [Muraenolepis orangiensis]